MSESFLQCKYSNGLGDVVEVIYTREGGLITADEVFDAMLDAMKGFGFMEKSIEDVVCDKALSLIECCSELKNDK